MDVSGKIAIVTGGGSGLGRYLCLGLAEAVLGVLVADVDEEAARKTAADVAAKGVHGKAVTADIRDAEQAHRVVLLAKEAGGPHILINNAGGWTPGEQYPAARAPDWIGTLNLNLIAPMLLTQLVLGPMRRLGEGAVVNIASSAGRGDEGYGSPEYGAAKAGLIRFTSSLAGLPDPIRVMCIVPGWIGLQRAHEEVARLPVEQRPDLIAPERIVGVALDLIRSGAAGEVVDLPD